MRLDDQPAALGHGVARIDGEVENGILDLAGVDAHGPQAGGQGRAYMDGLADRAAKQVHHAEDLLVQVDDGGLELSLSGEAEEAAGEPGPHFGGFAGMADEIRGLPARRGWPRAARGYR